MSISKSNQNAINKWKNLKSYSGFKLLVDELDKIIEESEQIIYAVGADSKPEFSKRDIAIIKRDNAMRIKELPDQMIKSFGGTGEMLISNPDAFQSSSERDDLDEIFKDDL